jgi:hypothetical protein
LFDSNCWRLGIPTPEAFSMMRLRILAAVAAMGLVGSVDVPGAAAQAVGFFHMPSTVGQYFGYGYGPGHHAPMVCTAAQRPDRMQRMAYAPPCAMPLGPMAYEPIGCYGGACPSCATAPFAATHPAPPAGVAPAAAYLTPMRPAPPVTPPVAMRPTPFGWR